MIQSKALKIGDLVAAVPVIQGGMGVGISLSSLAGADLIISGAGLPVNLPELVGKAKTKLAPIVSGVKSAQVIMRYWLKKYDRVPDLVVIEGPKAGGHLGFSLGTDGVQMGTRFVTTVECDASDAYKQTYLNAKEEDIILVKSPVGMPGRAIRNSFMERAKRGRIPHGKCHVCVSTCTSGKTPYCITEALLNAVKGNVEEALLFCGTNAYRATKIETVREIMEEFR